MSKSEVRIRLDGGSTHEVLKFDPEQVTRTNLTIEGIPEGAGLLTLQTKFNRVCGHCKYEAPKWANWNDQIRSAFIVPVSDSPVIPIGTMKNNLHSVRGEKVEVSVLKWDEGGEAAVDIDLEYFPGGDLRLIVETSWMDPGIGPGYFEGDCPHITISAFIDHNQPVADCTLAFEKITLPKTADSNLDLIQRLEEIEAYSLDGEGTQYTRSKF